MLRRVAFLFVLSSVLLVVWAIPAAASPITLQTAYTFSGNQAYNGVGVRFNINSPITVMQLGIFDSGQNGLAASSSAPLSAYLLTSSGNTVVSMAFDSFSAGILDVASGYRFKSIAPTVLGPGQYFLMGYGWSLADQEHNCFKGGVCPAFDNGGGLLTFVESAWGRGNDAAGAAPINFGSVGGMNGNYFSAASMRYVGGTPVSAAQNVPEPASCLLLAAGLAGLLGVSRKTRA